jgi:hypothetical protein
MGSMDISLKDDITVIIFLGIFLMAKPISRYTRSDRLSTVNINVENLVATVESFVEAFHPQVPVSLPGLVRRVPCTERSNSVTVNEKNIYATNTEFGGQILGRNLDKSLTSFPPYYSQ